MTARPGRRVLEIPLDAERDPELEARRRRGLRSAGPSPRPGGNCHPDVAEAARHRMVVDVPERRQRVSVSEILRSTVSSHRVGSTRLRNASAWVGTVTW